MIRVIKKMQDLSYFGSTGLNLYSFKGDLVLSGVSEVLSGLWRLIKLWKQFS